MTYFTVLRDPVERVISHFYYVRATPDNPRHAEAAGMTLEEFVTSALFPESDAGLLLLQRAGGWRPPYYVSKNVNAARPARAEVGARTLAIIREHTALDQRLYEEAASRLRADIEREGPGFAADLARFRRVNREYQILSRRLSAALTGVR